MYRKFWTLCIFIFIVNKPGYTQNLLPNGDFREQLTCIEFNQKCAPMGWRLTSADPPTYYRALKNNDSIAFSAWTAFIALNFIEKQYREYLQAPLLCQLTPGEKYLFSITIQPEKYAIKEFGIRFTENATILRANVLIPGKPDIIFHDNAYLFKKRGDWHTLTYEYFARGDEHYILIGNFLPDEETQYKSEKSGKKTMRIAYFIKNISLKPFKDTVLCDCSDLLKRLRHDRYRHTLFTNHFFQDSLALTLSKTTYKNNTAFTEIHTEKPGDSTMFPVIYFDFDQYSLREKSIVDLTSFTLYLKGIPEKTILLTGHTDSIGSTPYNDWLSLKRANAIKLFLIKQSIGPSQIKTFGKGSAEPITENNTPAGRQTNRRVEIKVLNKSIND